MAEPRNNGVLWLGTEKCDLLFRVAGIGAREGRRVAVVDDSLCGDMFSALAGASPGTDDVSRGNMEVLRGYQFDEGMLQAYDHVFLYQGMNEATSPGAPFGMMVVQCTALGHEVCRAASLAAASQADRTALVYRDRASKKVSPAALADEIGIEPDEVLCLDLDRRDEAQYVALTLDGDFGRLKDAGEDMREAAAWFCGQLYGMNAKAMKRYR